MNAHASALTPLGVRDSPALTPLRYCLGSKSRMAETRWGKLVSSTCASIGEMPPVGASRSLENTITISNSQFHRAPLSAMRRFAAPNQSAVKDMSTARWIRLHALARIPLGLHSRRNQAAAFTV